MLQRFHLFICLTFLHCLAMAPQVVYAQADITEPWKVVVDIKPMKWLISSLLRGVGTTEAVIDDSASAHHLHLKPSQAAMLEKADFIIILGAGLTPELEEIARKDDYSDRVINLESFAETLPARGEHHHGKGIDPHYWLDPMMMVQVLEKLAHELATRQPLRSKTIFSNLAQLKFSLFKTDTEVKAVFEGDKSTYPTFVAAHDAYQYLEKRYELTNGSYLVNHPDELTGASEQLELLSKYNEGDIACILTDANTPLIEQLAEKTNADVWLVDPINGAHDTVVVTYHVLLDSIAKKIRYCK